MAAQLTPVKKLAGLPACLQVLLEGGFLSYRALFSWVDPRVYLASMIGAPLFQILFFAYVGRFASRATDATYYVIGNAIQVCAMSGVYGMATTIANERRDGTLGLLLITPANRIAMFLGRSLMNLVNGWVVIATGFAFGLLFLNVDLSRVNLLLFGLIIASTVFATVSLGMVLGSLAIWGRDIFFLTNLGYALLLAVCGVNFPVSVLPPWLATIAYALPLTRGIAATRALAVGATAAQVMPLVVGELIVGAGYAALGFLLFRFFELAARRRGTLEEL